MDAPDFLKRDAATDEAVNESELTQLEELVVAYQTVNGEIEELEREIAERKEVFRKISQERIPELLNKHGLADIRLRNGVKVKVKEEASVSIPDEKEAKFFEFLEARNEADIIKLTISFPKMSEAMQQQLKDFLEGYEYEYDIKRGVHPSTLKAYVKKLLGVGEEDDVRKAGVAAGKYLRKQDVTDVMNVFTFFNTKLERK